MEIAKNKASGKYFIFIEYTKINSANFVTPYAEIKPLEFNIFEENSLVESTEYFLQHKLITNEQMKCYQQYLKDRSQDEAAREKARFDSKYGEWTPIELENQINRLTKLIYEKK